MKEERMLELIGQVKEEFIEEAAPAGVLNNDVTIKKAVKNVSGRGRVYRAAKWGALAACLCLIVGLSLKMNLFSATNDTAFEAMDQMLNQSVKGESYKEEAKTDDDAIKDEAGLNYGYNTGMTTGADTLTSEETIMSDNGFPDWGLTLTVENVTSTGLTLVVTQSGGEPTGELETGEAYRLITLVDGTWKTVEELPLPEGVDGRGWNSIAYLIPKNESKEFDINWEWIFGELPSGTYRLIKEFMDFRATANYDTFEYWVEFEIQ